MAGPTFYLTRTGGLGDVLMALAAVKALKAASGDRTVLITAPAYRSLALACPHLDQVITGAEDAQAALADIRLSAQAGRVANLDSVSFGLDPGHQVDAYLKAFGLAAAAEHKSLDLKLPESAQAAAASLLKPWPAPEPGRARILVHPAAGDPNRSWPQPHWQALAQALAGQGHQVIRVGNGSADPHRGILPLPGLLDAGDRLDPLGFVALCQASDLLVSTDSGPIQLAGASDIALVGLYTVVAGSSRLPFRHGQAGWRSQAVSAHCPHFPCYQIMQDEDQMRPVNAALSAGTITVPELFSGWCLVEPPYHCLTEEIRPERVLAACSAALTA